MKLKALIAGIAGSLAISTAAIAADPIIIPPPAPPPIVAAPVGYDWSGPYAGGSVFFAGGFAFGGQAGFNVVRGNLLLGAEVWFFVAPGNAVVVGQGKAGFLLGASDRLALYGTFGGGFTIGGGGSGLVSAAGLAVGITDRLSAFAELNWLGGTFIRGGVNFHFGN